MTSINYPWLIAKAQDMARHAAIAEAMTAKDSAAADYYNALVRSSLADIVSEMGLIAMPKADHLAMTGFIEEVRDHKPSVISGRHMGNRDPQDDLDDMMPLAEFEAFQDDAAKLIPRLVKAKAKPAPECDICGAAGEVRAYPNAGWTKPVHYCADCFTGRDGENSFTDFPLAGEAA